ncbi:MAG: AmmeMemoRadiSam system protein B [Devosia sp.]
MQGPLPDGVNLGKRRGAAVTPVWRLLVLVVAAALPFAAGGADDFLAPARDAGRLLAAIEAERPSFTPPAGVTGISVPHHLVAADLVARGFWAASAGHYSRIIVISPDHFHAVKGAFATTRGSLHTVFGKLASDRAGVNALLEYPGLFEALTDIDHEHGVMALAPFIAHFFPDAEVLPVLASINATPADWRAAAEHLKRLLGPETLIVQSTDYSHYLPLGEAVLRDQESLAMIAAKDPRNVPPLLQPSHMDSKAAQFVQMALQSEVYHSHPVVLANRNSAEYDSGTNRTTSYVVTAWLGDPQVASVFDYPDQTRVFFGGDVLAGRYLLPALHDPKAWSAIAEAIDAAAKGKPLLVNLEGVILGGPVTGLGADEHLMLMEDAAPVLSRFRTQAASLANNHANDLGEVGRAESSRLLSSIDIASLEHGVVGDFGSFRVVAINFIRGRLTGERIADPDDLEWVCKLAAAPPLIAFVHWGTEYTDRASAEESAIADRLTACGASLVVGAHPHRASPSIAPLAGGRGQMVYSLGNLLFDQSAPRGSGALMELRVFKQGTIAVRLVPIPNLFEVGRDALGK